MNEPTRVLAANVAPVGRRRALVTRLVGLEVPPRRIRHDRQIVTKWRGLATGVELPEVARW